MTAFSLPMEKIRYSAEYFNIEDTLTCGQVFRYRRSADGSFSVFSLDKTARLYYENGEVVIETDHPDYFYNYFDLGANYGEIVEKLSAYDELTEPIKFGKGIRILRQDFYETVFSFIISANNNITRIKNTIEKICAHYGENMGEFYAFPTLEKFQTASVSDLRALGLGYRAEYMIASASEFNGVEKQILQNPTLCVELLKTLKGVGDKVANCISLFSLHKTDSYPVDTWIFKANKSETLNTKEKVYAYYTARYGEYSGFAQQYIFHYNRKSKK